jgi:signal transduction histidine kinase
MRRLLLALWISGAAVGVAGEWFAYGFGAPRDWAPDVIAGWTLIASGLVCWSLRPGLRTGALMTAAGFAWFAGNFSAPLLYLHRGLLVALVLSYPRGKVSGRLAGAAVALVALAATLAPFARSAAATTILASCMIAIASIRALPVGNRAARAALATVLATALLGALFAGVAIARDALPTRRVDDVTRLGYAVAVSGLAAALAGGLLYAPWERAEARTLLGELPEIRSEPLRTALAAALGDPSLEIGYWEHGTATYVDTAGRELQLPTPGSARRVTRIEDDGHPLAALVHDPAVLDSPAMLGAVAAIARMAAANARLQIEVRGRLAELEASRVRLLLSEDAERRRLEARLRDGAERRLLALEQTLERARARTRGGTESARRVARAQEQLGRTLDDLRALARGLHPRALTEHGLCGGLTALAEGSHVPVQLSLATDRLREEIETVGYFVCSEALANVAKHAAAEHVSISVAVADDLVQIRIVDDGVGGADPAGGSGIRGIRDRVESLGGSLRVDSAPGAGTRVLAELPLGKRSDGGPDPAPGRS